MDSSADRAHRIAYFAELDRIRRIECGFKLETIMTESIIGIIAAVIGIGILVLLFKRGGT
jgi:hypothetical protein